MVFTPPVSVIGNSKNLLASLADALALVGFSPEDRYRTLHDEASLWGKRYAVLEKYRVSNEQVLDAIMSRGLSGFRDVVFMTGVSPALSLQGIAVKYGLDPFADIFGLTTFLLERAKKEREPFEDVLFFPVSPWLSPFVFKGASIEHALRSYVEEVSADMLVKKKRGFGRLDKSLADHGGVVNVQFRESLFDAVKREYEVWRSPIGFEGYREMVGAVDHVEDAVRRRIRLETQYHKSLMVPLFSSIARGLDLDVIHMYALKGSYATAIMEDVATETAIPLHMIGGKSGPLPKGKMTSLAEADPSCIDALTGFLQARSARSRRVKPNHAQKRERIAAGPSFDFKNCPYEEFIGCSHQDKCDAYRDPCALTHFHGLPDEEQGLVRSDMKEHKVRLFEGIEGVIAFLETEDFPAFSLEGVNYSWTRERGKITPLRLPAEVGLREPELSGDLRASSIGAKCVLSPLISLHGKRIAELYEGLTGERIIANNASRVGTAVHTLMLEQQERNDTSADRLFAPNRIWTKLGRDVVSRSEYCEKFVYTTIAGALVTGHLDAGVRVGGALQEGHIIDGKDIGIIDFKRARRIPYPKWANRFQLLTYAIAADELTGNEASRYYLILVNRWFDEPVTRSHIVHEGLYKLPEITVVVVEKKTDPLFALLEQQVREVHAGMREILSGNEILYARKRAKEAEGECIGCGTYLPDLKLQCDFIAGNVAKYGTLSEMIKKGGKA